MARWLSMDTAPKDADKVQLLLDDLAGESRKVFARWSQGQWWGLAEDGAFNLKDEQPMAWRPAGDEPAVSGDVSGRIA